MRTIRIYRALIVVAALVGFSIYLYNHAKFERGNVIFGSKFQQTIKLDADPKAIQLKDQYGLYYDRKSISDGIKSTSYNNSKVNKLLNGKSMSGKVLIFKSNDGQDTSHIQVDLKSSKAMDRKSGEYTHVDSDNGLQSTQMNVPNPKNLTDSESKLLEVLQSKPHVVVEPEFTKSPKSESIDNLQLINTDKENNAFPSPPKLPTSDTTKVNEDTEDGCNNVSVVTFNPGGRLGNRICEFIHLVDFQEKHSLQAFVHPGMWTSLNESFPNITLPVLSKNCLTKVENHTVAYGPAVDTPKSHMSSRILLTGSPCYPNVVWSSRTKWRRELVFSPQLQENAAARKSEEVKRWQAASNLTNAEQIKLEREESWQQSEGQAVLRASTLIGVHVRRGDYQSLLIQYAFGDLLPPEYYQRAFQFFRERYDCPLFLIITEPSQRSWCRKWMTNGSSDVVVVDDTSTPAQDLALLASMEHIIYSHGTFGLAAILLSNIKTLVYPAINPKSKAQRYLPYVELDKISKKIPSVNFVTVSSTKL